MKVIVIGAGVAGLSAAYELQRHHIDFLLLEADDHAGGRIAAENAGEFRADTGVQIFTESYSTAIRLCHEIGISEECSRRTGIYSKGSFRILDQNDPWTSLQTLHGFKLLSAQGLSQLIKPAQKIRTHSNQLRLNDASHAPLLDTETSIVDRMRKHAGSRLPEDLE
ncbi:MAG: FAD-dependent oxidoreductase [Gammaproteobacteria bacterium]|nr:FAD-dependent oxidoreductase [Gammaproteobacteria bacterium]